MSIASRRQILKCDTLDKDATCAVEVLRTGRRLLGADCVTDVSRKNFLRLFAQNISLSKQGTIKIERGKEETRGKGSQ